MHNIAVKVMFWARKKGNGPRQLPCPICEICRALRNLLKVFFHYHSAAMCFLTTFDLQYPRGSFHVSVISLERNIDIIDSFVCFYFSFVILMMRYVRPQNADVIC